MNPNLSDAFCLREWELNLGVGRQEREGVNNVLAYFFLFIYFFMSIRESSMSTPIGYTEIPLQARPFVRLLWGPSTGALILPHSFVAGAL